nr:hypothetical protein Iba_chr06aCG20710 [Ipomoea batatas]GMD08557.1 hypothetical protein Iba_chr06cCG17820 [Ipomoea batatas]GME13400.1 hypothetical protein Iba_scaffold14416CG0010 [Ipomoea batatas]GME14650.1 hypothetical protein Iba_scaffold15351CG0060 [Ipomoea batatas]
MIEFGKKRRIEDSRVPFGKLVANLKADGFDPAGGELRLVSIEAIAVGRNNLG